MVRGADTAERLLIVSGDGHAGARPETYRDYMDPEFRSAIDDLELESVEWNRLTKYEELARDDEFPGWNLSSRMKALDAEGVAAEVMHSGVQGAPVPFFAASNKPRSPELQWAGSRAYNRWLADWMVDSGHRILGVAATGPCLDINATLRELEWAAEQGFVAAKLPQNILQPELPPIYDRYYDPIWAACQDLGLRLSVHAGWGVQQGRFWEFAATFVRNVLGRDLNDLSAGGSEEVAARITDAMAKSADSPMALDIAPRRAIWQLMVGGVFDRYPRLVTVVTELRADWLPATLAVLDARCREVPQPMELLPSEYWARNCFITPSSIHQSEVEMRYDIGVDKMLFGSDCPHPEATYPQTRDWLRFTFREVPLEETRAILGDNAVRCYGLDRAKLEEVAARVGPTAGDLFDGGEVDSELIVDFDRRAGLLRSAEEVDTLTVRQLLDEDLTATGVQLT